MRSFIGSAGPARRRRDGAAGPPPSSGGPAPGNVFTGATFHVEDNLGPHAHTYSKAVIQYNRMVTKNNDAADPLFGTLTSRIQAFKKIRESAFAVKYLEEWMELKNASGVVDSVETRIDQWMERMNNRGGALALKGCYALPNKSNENRGFKDGDGDGTDTQLGYAYPVNGLLGHEKYRHWITRIANKFALYPNNKIVFIVEADGLSTSGLDTTSTSTTAYLSAKAREVSLLHLATEMRNIAPHVAVYIDALHSGWRTLEYKRDKMLVCGIDKMRGFCSNISNFRTTAVEQTYNTDLVNLLAAAGVADRRFLVDTSRNGNGPITTLHSCQSPDTNCCKPEHNPPPFPVTGYAGAALGHRPGYVTPDNALCDAYIWAKTPGGSDFACGDNSYLSGTQFYPGPGGWIENTTEETGYGIDLCLNTSWTV